MHGREPESLHLDIPNTWSKIERVAASLVSESGYLLLALAGGNCGSRKELVRRSYGSTLLGPGGQTPYANNAGKEVEIGSHVPLEAIMTAPGPR
jgi:hypothetical protein